MLMCIHLSAHLEKSFMTFLIISVFEDGILDGRLRHLLENI